MIMIFLNNVKHYISRVNVSKQVNKEWNTISESKFRVYHEGKQN